MVLWPYNLFPAAIIILQSELFPIVVAQGAHYIYPGSQSFPSIDFGVCPVCINCPPPPTHSHAHYLELFFQAKLVKWWIKMISAQSLKAFVLIFKIHRGNALPKSKNTDKAVGLHLGGISQGPWKSHMTMWGHRSFISQILGMDIFFCVTALLGLLSPWVMASICGFLVTCGLGLTSPRASGKVASNGDTMKNKTSSYLSTLVRQMIKT